jgi:hypothetical protein
MGVMCKVSIIDYSVSGGVCGGGRDSGGTGRGSTGKLLWKYCQTRNQATLRDVEFGFLLYFMPVVPDELVLKILDPHQ